MFACLSNVGIGVAAICICSSLMCSIVWPTYLQRFRHSLIRGTDVYFTAKVSVHAFHLTHTFPVAIILVAKTAAPTMFLSICSIGHACVFM